MEQVWLCTVCAMENWLGTSKTTHRVGWMIWICYSCALERWCLLHIRPVLCIVLQLNYQLTEQSCFFKDAEQTLQVLCLSKLLGSRVISHAMWKCFVGNTRTCNEILIQGAATGWPKGNGKKLTFLKTSSQCINLTNQVVCFDQRMKLEQSECLFDHTLNVSDDTNLLIMRAQVFSFVFSLWSQCSVE